MTRRQLFILLLLLVIMPLPSPEVYAKTIKVSTSGGIAKIHAFQQEKITYISFSELVEILGGLLDWAVVGHQISYVEGTNRFDFVIGSPFFKINDSLYNLTFPAVYKNGQLFLPAETFVPYLDGVMPQLISWSRDSETLRLDSEYFNVTDLAIQPKANGLLIEIFLSSALAYEVFVTEGNWLNVSIRDAKLNSRKIQSSFDRKYMYDLKTHQLTGSGQISLRLRRNIDKWHHQLVSDPPRIQISIADVDFEMSAKSSRTIGPDDKIDVVVIDPGHGGSDYGAIGRRGTREKDVVLGIAKELAKLIRKDKQFKVVMTRDRDKLVTLQQRADIANRACADLFISLHANASTKKHVRGWNIFFLAPAKNDSARAVAQFENSFFVREKAGFASESEEYTGYLDNPVLTILNEMIMTEFQAESHDFAMMLDREFRRSLDIPSRGVDQAGFFVLNMVFTPSILVETGFISNLVEEKTLKNRRFQKTVAEAIYEAIKRFKAKYES
ncbi:MAG: N-acetylmuramoyl-L-alanine amidase [Candidatus Zixiibacteriota bacterium]